jgi:predicted kinase
MSSKESTLHLVCGKIAAGKSTLANALGLMPGAILVKEDYWLARLYPDEQNSLADYIRNSTRLRDAMTAHLIELLKGGMTVVLDFPANTLASRAWMRTLFEAAGCMHKLHYLNVSDEVCKARLRRRNDGGGHEFNVSDEDFDLFTSPLFHPLPTRDSRWCGIARSLRISAIGCRPTDSGQITHHQRPRRRMCKKGSELFIGLCLSRKAMLARPAPDGRIHASSERRSDLAAKGVAAGDPAAVGRVAERVDPLRGKVGEMLAV